MRKRIKEESQPRPRYRPRVCGRLPDWCRQRGRSRRAGANYNSSSTPQPPEIGPNTWIHENTAAKLSRLSSPPILLSFLVLLLALPHGPADLIYLASAHPGLKPSRYRLRILVKFRILRFVIDQTRYRRVVLIQISLSRCCATSMPFCCS
jgi:hypothetical protein